jgi:hypothetical protein
MEKLYDLLGTAYAYDSYVEDLLKLSNTVNELDIAGVNFTPPAYTMLMSNFIWKGKRVIDSADVFRNTLLEQNMQVVRETPEIDKAVKMFPRFAKGDNLISYVQKLDSSQIYEKGYFLDSEYENVALITFIALTRPKIRVRWQTDMLSIYKRVKFWLRLDGVRELLETETNFNYCVAGIVLPVQLNFKEQTEFVLEGLGTYSKQELLEKVCILPTNFGEVQLSKHPVWQRVLIACSDILEPSFNEINMSMKQFITKRAGLA